MKKQKYPLAQLLEIKQKRLDEAEKYLKKAQEELKKEQNTLKTIEEERDEVLRHKTDKMNQLREKIDEGTNTQKIELMRVYLKIVEEKLAIKEKKVMDQQKIVEEKTTIVLNAKQDFLKKRQETEKLLIHKEEWSKEHLILLRQEGEKEEDEIGTIIHTGKKYKR